MVEPYFDEKFYTVEYASELELSGEDSLTHFMRRSGRFLGGDFDPNPWFNVTLYKDRLWPCSGNAFVDFLKQPKMQLQENTQTIKVVEIYANNDQIYRAWMAAEGFMRKNKFQIVLILPSALKDKIPDCFKPMIARGLIVQFSNASDMSFYKSPFLKNPSEYDATNLPSVTSGESHTPITHFSKKTGRHYLMHRLYNYTFWKDGGIFSLKNKGILNPCMLNFAQYAYEPVEFSKFGRDEYTFKKSMQRLAPGFDLMLINSDIQTKNLRIIPGYMFYAVETSEAEPVKKYEVSFMLSLGGKGMESFRTRGTFVYHFRKSVWNNEKKIPLPTNFYISRRDIHMFPEVLQKKAMPTSSKKWIYGSQFSIAIENSIQPNFFSEKLLGCFGCMTIPIYIGCPNITEFFDPRGMFIAKDPDDALRIAQRITPETYAKMKPYLEENKKRAAKFVKLEDTYINEFFEKEVE